MKVVIQDVCWFDGMEALPTWARIPCEPHGTGTIALGRRHVLPRRIPALTTETEAPLKSINQTCKHVEGAKFADVRS